MKNELSEPAWSGYEQEIPVAQETANDLENVTCAGLSNADERRAAFDALTPWIDKYKTGPLFEDDKGRVLILKKHLYNFIACYELAQNIREALTAPRVPVIDGLDIALEDADYQYNDDYDEYVIFCGTQAHAGLILKAARAYAELQKGK